MLFSLKKVYIKLFTKRIKGWRVPITYTDTPLMSKRMAKLKGARLKELMVRLRNSRK